MMIYWDKDWPFRCGFMRDFDRDPPTVVGIQVIGLVFLWG